MFFVDSPLIEAFPQVPKFISKVGWPILDQDRNGEGQESDGSTLKKGGDQRQGKKSDEHHSISKSDLSNRAKSVSIYFCGLARHKTKNLEQTSSHSRFRFVTDVHC